MVISIVFSFASVTFSILCERKINIEKDMLLKDKNQSKRTIKMDLNNFDKTLLRDVIGKKENNEKSYLFYQELFNRTLVGDTTSV